MHWRPVSEEGGILDLRAHLSDALSKTVTPRDQADASLVGADHLETGMLVGLDSRSGYNSFCDHCREATKSYLRVENN